MKVGVQIVERYLVGGGIHSITGTDGSNACFPAMNPVTAYEILEKDGYINKRTEHLAPPILRVLKNGRVTITEIVPILAENVEERKPKI